MNKSIGIFGAGGLIGTELQSFLSPSFSVITLKSSLLYEKPEDIYLKIKDLDIIINLAGYPIAGRWNKNKKEKIYNSRILTTRNLVKAMGVGPGRTELLINASAVGIYKDGIICDENSMRFADNFLAKVVSDWETEAKAAQLINVNLSVIRIGVVLSRRGGAYPLLRRVIKYGIGGTMGNGKQGFSFILINDLVRIFEFVIQNKLYGIINAVAPEPVNNRIFINELAGKLKRPAFIPLPGFIIRLFFGEGSCTLLDGQKVIPLRLIENKFRFVGNNLNDCLTILEK